MRFISQYRNYSISLIPEKLQTFADGEKNIIQEGVRADFKPLGLFPWEVEPARNRLVYRGVSPEELEYPLPTIRASVYDTDIEADLEGWDADRKTLVEQKLLKNRALGVDYVHVAKPATPVPFAKYPTTKTPKEALAAADLVGVGIDQLIAYEQENENRADWIEAFDKAQERVASDEITVSV